MASPNKSKIYNVRSSAILTNAYVAGTTITDCHGYNELTVTVDFTKGSLTDAQLKIEFSEDNTIFTRETFASISGGVKTLSLGVELMAATGIYTYQIPISTEFIKISAIGTDTVTNSLMSITAVLAEV